MTISDNEHDRIIYMRKAFDDTCQMLTDEGFDSKEITITMLNFSIAIMYKRISFDYAIKTLADIISILQNDHKPKEYKH